MRVEEIKAGVEEKKKTQGMRRDLGHKGCGRSHHPNFNLFPSLPSLVLYYSATQGRYFFPSRISAILAHA